MNKDGLKTIGFVLMALVGGAAALLPLLGLALVTMAASLRPFPLTNVLPTYVGAAVLGVALGAWILAHAILGLMKRPSRPFRLPGAWMWLAGFAAAIAVILIVEPTSTVVVTLLRVLAALLPALAVLSFFTRRLSDAPAPATWRQAAAQASVTASFTIGWSFLWEMLAFALIMIAVGVVIGVAPGGLEYLEQWSQRFSDPLALQGGDLLREPGVLAILLTLAVGFVPIIEETGKALGMCMLALVRRPTRAQAVVWGLVTGAVFGVMEASFAQASDAQGGAMVAILRVGTLLMHCCAATMTAVGLYEWVSQRRPKWFFASLGLSVGLHAAWNAVAVAFAPLNALGSQWVPWQIVVLGTFAILSGGAAFVLAHLTRSE